MRVWNAAFTAIVGSLAALAVVATTGAPRTAAEQAAATPIYQDPSYSFAERSADLVSRMSVAEKAAQTISSVAPAIPRLGIAQYGWWNEALHGVSRLQYTNNANATTLTNTTSYPIDQSLGASWDPALIYKVATAISDESREVVPNNVLNLDFYSPTMNLERDPRWGRNDEAYGEDPYLVTKLVDQFVNGMEGNDENGQLLAAGNGYKKLLTTIKHYALNNSEVNRRTGSSDADDRTIREYYTKAFRGIVQDAQPASVMSSYNRVNGVPAAADPYLIDTLMRQTFGFNGYMTSDCDAVYEIVAGHHYQPPDWTRPVNNTERHALAMSAGEDSNCQVGYHDAFSNLNSVPAALGQGIKTPLDTFNANDLDNTVQRLFQARMSTGEFDDYANQPWVQQARARVPAGTWTNANTNNAVTETADRLALAREAGDKTIVLLKNSKNVLPLKPPASGPYKVAVIGYFSNPSSVYLGGYSSTQGTAGAAKIVNGYNGLKTAIQAIDPDATVDYFKGFTGTGTTAASLTAVDPAAVAAAANYDAVIVYAGTDAGTANEDVDRAAITLPGAQGSLISQVAAANPNTAVHMETIGPIDVSSWEPSVGSILWSSYNGQRKGESLADVVLGKYDPSGRLPSTWFANVGQLPSVIDYDIRGSDTKPGRTYQYFKGAPAYPFGFGLSYTTFGYSNLRVDKKALTPDDTFAVTFDVTNNGTVAGTETPQLYVTQPDAPASAQRPARRLVAFQKVALDPGQTKTVTLNVEVADVAYSDGGKWSVDSGRYGVEVSRAAGDAALSDTVNVSGALTAVPSVVTVKPAATGDSARDIQRRVLFPEGVGIVPNVTVAMNDDTLWGFISKGRSRAFPDGLTVTYSSNRPSVVAVDGSSLRTVSNGVATVTATVSYHGVTKSAKFVVRVLSYLSGLTVDGKTVRNFAPDTFSYDVVLPAGYSGVPSVAAMATDPAATVAVTQASGVPGAATVAVTASDGNTYTYMVGFAKYGSSDEFNGDALGSQWSVLRPNAATSSVSGGALKITAEAGDLTTTTNTAKNLVLQNAPGDWTIESKLDFSVIPHVNNQQGGIIAYGSDNDYLRLAWEWSTNAARITETIEDGLSGTPVNQVLANVPTAAILGTGKTIYFRMVKTGPRYASYYSADGSTWTLIYETGAALSNVKVGLFAFNRAGTSADLTVSADYFRVLDTVAPVTTASVSPEPVNGAVNGPATITLSATDTGSGVASTEYQVDGGGWQPYTAPFVVANGGGRVIQYRSTDAAGNVEAAKTLNLIVNPQASGTVGGTVPATLALKLGPAASFGAFTPGVAHDYSASTTANVVSTAGDARLDVSDPGHLANGAFTLPSPLGVTGVPRTWSAPVSNDTFTIGFTQHIGANDALRTGSYSKTLTFTLSTTTP